LTPVALEEIPESPNLPMVEAPQINLPPVPVVSDAGKLRRERKRPVTKPTPAPEPVQVAAAAEPSPEETAIGALTAGGEANPQTKQEAADLITSSEKRLKALQAKKEKDEKAQVNKVKNFLKDAQDALKSGDAEERRR
jgi:hypothetical protein